MAAIQRTTVVGVFHDRNDADRAVDELRRNGFREDQIGVITRGAEGVDETVEVGEGSHVAEGALTGAVAGAGVGGLIGLGLMAGIIPAIGPVLAGGWLIALLANAGAGAAIGGLAGSLIGAGVPEEEANYYHTEFESGRTIVSVKAETRFSDAEAILRRHGAYDMSSPAGAARGSSTATAGRAVSTGRGAATAGAGTDRAMELREEELHARKQPVDAGEVRVRKDVVTEHKTIDVPVEHEEVVVERHSPSHPGATTTGAIRPGEEIRIPVRDEKVVVDKQAVVKQEVTVGKRTVKDTERVSGDVRKEQLRVEKEGDVDVRSGDAGERENT